MPETPAVMKNQPCPMCMKKTLVLTEAEKEVPYFGKCYLFSMNCSNPECGYFKADVEAVAEKNEPAKYTLEISSEDDMKIRVIKSSSAKVSIPRMISSEPGPSSNGYITNVEGVLSRFKKQLEVSRDTSEDNEDRNKAKTHLKKLLNAMWGREKLTLIIEDPNGNSAIISDKAKKERLKAKKE